MTLIWSCDEVAELVGGEDHFKRVFERKARHLDAHVRRTRQGVVHGYGTVARIDLPKNLELADPFAVYQKKTQGEGVRFQDGAFSIDKAPTYYLNEARGQPPNVEWMVAVEKGRRPVLYWRILCDIHQGDELLVLYD